MRAAAVILIIVSALAMAVFGGYHWCNSVHSDALLKKNRKIASLQAEFQALQEKKAQQTEELARLSLEKARAVKASESAKRAERRADDMIRSCLKDKGEAIDEKYRILDLLESERLYAVAVTRSCAGLPEADSASLVPSAAGKTTVELVAGGFSELAGTVCKYARLYNGLYQSYDEAMKHGRTVH